MTQYEALNEKNVKVHNIKNKTYQKQDSDMLFVDKVILEVEDHEIPKNKITINPTLKETELTTKLVDGQEIQNETTVKRDPTVNELLSEFPRIKELFKALNDYNQIELTGLIRCVRDSQQDEWNMFIRQSELDGFEAQPIQKDREDETDKLNQDFIEDQTNIDVSDSDQDKETGDQEVSFGEKD